MTHDFMLLERINAVAIDNIDRTAISCPIEGELSYRHFLDASGQIRLQFAEDDVEPGDRVAVFLQRSATFVAAIHAVLSAHCVYVPIFHGSPPERLKTILTDCEPAVLICDTRTTATASQAISESGLATRLIQIDPQLWEQPAAARTGVLPLHRPKPGDYFSIMYTSGSTGTPKGVMLTHENLGYYINWAVDYFEIGPEDVVFSTAPFHFDMSSFDVFSALASGAKLVIASEKECLFPKVLLRRLEDEGATIWKGVSPLLANVARSIDLTRSELSRLRALIFSGDRIPVAELRTWMAAFQDVTFFNAYGPTEATGVSCCYKITGPVDEADFVPIGQARAKNEISLLDGDEFIDTVNHHGEIVLSGPGIAKGYWRDETKTESAFFTRPNESDPTTRAYRTGDIGYFDENGDVIFVGRLDRQVKHQGYRIELDEIETQLRRMPGIVDCAVVHIPHGVSPGLAAFFETDDTVDETAAREYLAINLPAYMVPRLISRVSSLPKSDRGKIDYIALAERV